MNKVIAKLFTALIITGYFFNLTFPAKAHCQDASLITPESNGNGQELIKESFMSRSTDWKEIYLEGIKEEGKYTISNGKLIVNTIHPKSIFGVYHPTPFSDIFMQRWNLIKTTIANWHWFMQRMEYQTPIISHQFV